ncbi:MAG: hypothetical protein GX482_01940 [Acholeplasmataceae bacterium]|jgi:phosphotransacetylase|nr:hypothetical protein [Acholeplasmataceae bacterium]
MRILAMMPYQKNLLSALAEAAAFGTGMFLLVGDKKRIVETCYVNNIDHRRFEILNFPLDIEAVEHAKMLIDEKRIDYLLVGEVPEIYVLNVFGMRNPLAIGSIDVIDIPALRKFLFISNKNRNFYVDFEDKKEAILQARPVLKGLGIKKVSVALLTNTNNNNEVLESNIVKMLVMDGDIADVEILGIQDFGSFLRAGKHFNLFNSGATLLILKNHEIARVFLNTLSAFTNSKIASFSVYNQHLVLDAKVLDSKENILFSLLILEKLNSIKASALAKR